MAEEDKWIISGRVKEEKLEDTSSQPEIDIWKDIEVPLVFEKYDIREVVVHDLSLQRYINLKPRYVYSTSARQSANKRFGNMKISIVERLINKMMRTEKYTGKKTKAYKVVAEAFDIIAHKSKKNPIQVLVNALERAAPMEEITRLRYGGISVPKAVDVSASRRLDIALGNICKGAVKSSYKTTKPISLCLANEILKASEGNMESFAVSKKDEVERIAASAR